jgi:hypothetical protein
MRLGSCYACPTKDSEIAFLRSQVTSLQEQNRELQGKVLNLADPLLDARLAAAHAPVATVNPSPRRLPWRMREDREPETPKPEQDIRTNAEVHDSFRVEEQAG